MYIQAWSFSNIHVKIDQTTTQSVQYDLTISQNAA